MVEQACFSRSRALFSLPSIHQQIRKHIIILFVFYSMKFDFPFYGKDPDCRCRRLWPRIILGEKKQGVTGGRKSHIIGRLIIYVPHRIRSWAIITVNKSNQTEKHTKIKARRYKKIIRTRFFPEEHHLQDRRFGEYWNCHLHSGDGKKTEKSSTSRLSNNSNDVSTIKWNSMTTCRKVWEFLTSPLTTKEWPGTPSAVKGLVS